MSNNQISLKYLTSYWKLGESGSIIASKHFTNTIDHSGSTYTEMVPIHDMLLLEVQGLNFKFYSIPSCSTLKC